MKEKLRKIRLLTIVLILFLGFMAGSVAFAAPGDIERVSLFPGDDGLEERVLDSQKAAISADGRLVAFETRDSSWNTRVYIHDRDADTTQEFSTNVYVSGFYSPDISADGNFVAVAYRHQVGEDPAVVRLLVKEWGAEPENLIDIEPTDIIDTITDGYAYFDAPSISGDGCRVAIEFEYEAKGINDIYLYDCVSEEVTLISVAGDGSSFDPALSDDGKFVAFRSRATNLVDPPITDGMSHVYIRNIQEGTTEIVTLPGEYAAYNGESYAPSLSSDGRYVAFEYSYYDDEENYFQEIFVHDRMTKETILVSLIDGLPRGGSVEPSISGDGRFVTFTGWLEGSNEDWWNDIYVHDQLKGTTTLVTRGFTGDPGEEFGSSCSVISANGRFIAFESGDPELVPEDTNNKSDIFVYENDISLPVMGSISGTVTCSGSLSGSTHTIFVDLYESDTTPPPDATQHIACGESYTFDELPDGSYYVSAWLDTNDSGGGPPDPDEPAAWYGAPTVIVISGGEAKTGIDITLGSSIGIFLPLILN